MGECITMLSFKLCKSEPFDWIITSQPWSKIRWTLCKNACSVISIPFKSMLLVAICTLSWFYSLSYNRVWIYWDLFIRQHARNTTSLRQLITSQSSWRLLNYLNEWVNIFISGINVSLTWNIVLKWRVNCRGALCLIIINFSHFKRIANFFSINTILSILAKTYSIFRVWLKGVEISSWFLWI